MAIRLKEWIQREWSQPGVTLFDAPGDFYDLSGLMPHQSGRKLVRAPAWSTKVAATYNSNDAPIQLGAFYDEANDRRVVLVTQADADLYTIYFSKDWTCNDGGEISIILSDLGGLHAQNVVYCSEQLYLIGDNGHTYKCTTYTGSLTAVYSGGDSAIVTPHGDFAYIATTTGEIRQIKSASEVSLFTPEINLDPIYMTSYKNYLMLVSQGRDGILYFYRFTDSGVLVPIGQIPGSGNYPAGCMFTTYNDLVYFSPGRFKTINNTFALPIYSFNGTRFEFVAQLDNLPTAYVDASGFLHWRGQLIFYSLDQRTGITDHDFRILIGDKFTPFLPYSDTNGYGYLPAAWSLGGELMFPTRTASAAHGIHHAGSSALSDGYITTSYLDMDSPGRLKRLESLAAFVDTAATDFKVLIKYRVNDTAGWTTAVTANNTHRATAADLAVEFYRLQIRVELDDDTAGHVNAAIEAISARYTIEQ